MAKRDPLRPAGLGPRGAALWREMATDDASAARKVLVGEAARLADRADKLDRLLRGDVTLWVRLSHRLLTRDYELKVDSAASEARQTATALRQIVNQLRASGEPAAPATGDDLEDELESRRAAREAGSAG